MSDSAARSRLIGIVGKPHGIKGYVFVRMFTDYPSTINKDDILFLDERCYEKVQVEDIKYLGGKSTQRIVFKFYGINSRSRAEILRNSHLYRRSLNQPYLSENTYWIDELTGCEIYLQNGCFYGTVKEIEKYAYNDNLIVQCSNGKIAAIPMLEDYIDSIDIANKRINLKQLPEYI